MMRRRTCLLAMLLLALALGMKAQENPRCIHFNGVALEGHVDSLAATLKARGYTEWGQSADSNEFFFRGNFYGLRVKLMLSTDVHTHYVTSALVTCGPYRTKEMLEHNRRYFLTKLQQEYDTFSERNDAHYYMDDYGMVKLSVSDNGNGSSDIRVFFMSNTPFYKDAMGMGLKGHVQQIVTESPVAEEPMEQFDQTGKMKNPNLVDREYDRHGYLKRATMREETGANSVVAYDYDAQYRLSKRTLTNLSAGIKYVNEYKYNADNEITSQLQRVFDHTGECIVSISLKNKYEEHDDNGNWTRNTLDIVYWEKGHEAQPGTVVQTRTISYWDE